MKHKYIDLFCGAGGLGEGFKQAGFESAFHVDMDKWAIQTITLREIFHKHKDNSKFFEILTENCETPFSPENLFSKESAFPDYEEITKKILCGKIDENYEQVLTGIKNGVKNEQHSIIIGGPPCQAYSLAKRSRMRAPTDDIDGKKLEGKLLKEAKKLNKNRVKQYLSDDRHTLFETYLNIINEISPSAFVYENVPGILTAEKSMDKDDQKAKIIDLFKTDIGSKAEQYKLLCVDEPNQITLLENQEINFDDFIVNASDYGVPQNRKRFIIIGIRKDLTNNVEYQKVFESSVSAHRLKVKRTVKDAIKDLPALSSNRGNNYYLESPINESQSSDYSKNLINHKVSGIFNHFARSHMKEDLERYKYFSDFVLEHNRNANLYDLCENRKDLLPDHKSGSSSKLFDASGKKTGKYVDRFKVQAWDKPATTITAHISKDGHAFIHPDSSQNRSLTARETARLQSFPDSYIFCGPRTEQFRQIGNAVPVKLAFVIAEGIKSILDANG